MDCNITDFYISHIQNISFIDQKIYLNNFVEYRPYLYWDELIYFKDTFATVYFDNQVFNIEPDNILFLTSGDHQKYIIEFHQSGTFTDIFFTSNLHFNSKPALYQSLSLDIYGNFQRILAAWQQNPVKNRAECMSILWNLIYKIQNCYRLSRLNYDSLKPAIDYIKANCFNTQISTKKLASQCGMNYSQFLENFKQKFHTTPKSYVISLKIDKACEMLKTQKSIVEISENLGFTDVCFFSKQFKKYMNLSPSEYRKKFLQNNEYYNYVKPWEKT